ncbi:glycosyltransferase family 2 protein [Georgenia muralis]|uniref:Glycosyl transferase family 2 n=1 Tax=Georgenia muralis TaxID=154117 RepID=A0A3N4YZY4_9MICO|nr:glycosyltransferase family A protein [Georgenia muralis]RPF25943.1 glycosyl transferase family 2 [Georgenia muralis]
MTTGLGVVIPAYQAERTLARAVASARACGAEEVVVVDDGSTDSTAALARSLGCTTLVQSNAGAAAARRAGVRACTAAVIVLLDADDELVPSGVARSLALLPSRGADCAGVGGVTLAVAPGGGERTMRARRRRVRLDDLLRDGFAPGAPAAIVWRAPVLRAAVADAPPGLWPAYAEDYELTVRAVGSGHLEFHDEVSARYTLAGGKSTHDPMRSIAASEAIRLHYAGVHAVPVHPRPPRALRARVLLREAMNLRAGGPRTHPRYGALILRAAAADPGLVAAMTARKVRDGLSRRRRRAAR